MGANDLLLLLIPIGGLAAYMTNAGGFKTWVDSAFAGQPVDAQPQPGVRPPRPTNPLVSTLCKCGTGTAKHVIGDCNACKSTCVATCGNCSPQCLFGTKSNLAFAQSYASYPMKGLIVS